MTDTHSMGVAELITLEIMVAFNTKRNTIEAT
jgi:hypothetical protein